MTSQSRSSIANQLSAASLAINNTTNDHEIGTLVTVYGYTAAKMDEGRQLYLRAADAVKKQTFASGAQRKATQQAQAAELRARASYQALAQVARAVFARNTPARTMLGLVGTRPVAATAFLHVASQLFDNALNVKEISATLAGYGYDEKRLAHERAMIAAFEQARQAQVAAMGTAQQATHDQRVALAALTTWLAQYLKIARVALRDKPQLYEKLGGIVRSTRTAAQRQAPKKAAATRAAKKAA
jgi:hypothetical protein